MKIDDIELVLIAGSPDARYMASVNGKVVEFNLNGIKQPGRVHFVGHVLADGKAAVKYTIISEDDNAIQ